MEEKVLKRKYFKSEDLKDLKDSCHAYKYEVTDKGKVSLEFYCLEEAVMALNAINCGELYGYNSTDGRFLMAKKIKSYFPIFYTVGKVDTEEIKHLKKTSDCLRYCTDKLLVLQYRVGEEEKKYFKLEEAVEKYNNSSSQKTLWVEAGDNICVALATQARVVPNQLYKDLNLKGVRTCYSRIEKAIDSLPKTEKIALLLKYFNYLCDKKIAEKLSISYQTERKDINKALLSLRVSINNMMASPI